MWELLRLSVTREELLRGVCYHCRNYYEEVSSSGGIIVRIITIFELLRGIITISELLRFLNYYEELLRFSNYYENEGKFDLIIRLTT